jgi:hypothetical protein
MYSYYRRNSDEHLRNLERLWWDSNDDRDLDRWFRELVRTGQISLYIETMLPIWRAYAANNDYDQQTLRNRLLRSLERIDQLLHFVPPLDRWLWGYNVDDPVIIPNEAGEPEAIRVVGDAIIEISFIGDRWYAGRVGVPDNADWVTWEFTNIGAPGIGWGAGIGYDSDYAFDEIALSAIRFGSHSYEDDPDEDTAAYIEGAVQYPYISEDGDELDSQEMIELGRMVRIDIGRLER